MTCEQNYGMSHHCKSLFRVPRVAEERTWFSTGNLLRPKHAYLQPTMITPRDQLTQKTLIIRHSSDYHIPSTFQNLDIKLSDNLQDHISTVSPRRRAVYVDQPTSGNNLHNSINATSFPRQTLLPIPNENCLASNSNPLCSLSSHLSGRNASASSP